MQYIASNETKESRFSVKDKASQIGLNQPSSFEEENVVAERDQFCACVTLVLCKGIIPRRGMIITHVLVAGFIISI